jgi:hypothetical protein
VRSLCSAVWIFFPKTFTSAAKADQLLAWIAAPEALGLRVDSSFAPLGLDWFPFRFPTAYAVGCILSPLRGWAGETPALNHSLLLRLLFHKNTSTPILLL